MPPSTQAACRIVICDDQPGFRRLLAAVLGLEPELQVVGEAGDGREAIAIVRELEPSVVLLDVAMPEMDGIEALPHILAASPGTTVVMVTAYGSPSVRERALEAGATSFIEKGTDVNEMVDLIKRACSAN